MFHSLRQHRNYRLFFTGQVISVSGTWMQNLAMYWFVLQLSGSAVAVGWLSFWRFLPSLILAPFAGTLADRLDSRRVVIVTQAVQMVLAGALATFVLLGHARIWQVDAVAALMGSVLCLDMPARQMLTYQMVGSNELRNAVALNSTLWNAARIGGPVLGGIVIASFGVAWCFVANAISFLAVIASLLLMRRSEMFLLKRFGRPTLVSGTREGVHFVRSKPLIAAALGLVGVYAALLFNVDVLLPILTHQALHRGPGTFAVLTSSFGAGALLGALTVAARGREPWRSIIAAAVGLALAFLAIAPSRNLLLIAGLLVIAGAFFTVFTANANALFQLETPDHLRGRVISLYFYAWNALAPVGALLISWLCSVGSTTLAFTVVGSCGLAAVAVVELRLTGSFPRLHAHHLNGEAPQTGAIETGGSGPGYNVESSRTTC